MQKVTPPPRDSASGLVFRSSFYNEGKIIVLVGIPYRSNGSDKDTYHVALARTCGSPPIKYVKLCTINFSKLYVRAKIYTKNSLNPDAFVS